ncbi:M14 family metallopeptidase [Bacillus sp. JJ1474]|uniref:M14 family metallopeptidase n=1 Tax=Bacillus sp. JJ1474 TaxID=3122955 RepID=UPI002FFD97D8
MKNILALWSKEGLLRDKNGDGVVDSTSIYINLPEHLVPEGLIDFCGRLGFETTSLSFHFFEKSDKAIQMDFEHSELFTAIRVENQHLVVSYKDEIELSTLLKLLASMEPELITEKSSRIELKDGRLYSGQTIIPTLAVRKDCHNTYPKINSLADFWSFSGIGKISEASPSKAFSMNIDVEDLLWTPELLRELCHLAARGAMYSTKIEFPITGNADAALQFQVTEGSNMMLELPYPNTLRLAGNKTNLPAAIYHLARAKHWSEGGEFGYWEQEHKLSQKTEPSLLFEMNWTDEWEADRAFEVLANEKDLEGANIEIYLSEPLEVRKALEKEWQLHFPQIKSITIRSAFKTGFHWFIEEVLPEFIDSEIQDEGIQGIEIKVQKQAGKNALELPIRWIQELYPLDKYIEKEIGLKAELVQYALEDGLEHTYEVYRIGKLGEKYLMGYLDVPVSKLPYVDEKHSVYPSSSAVRILKFGEEPIEHIVQSDRERFYRFYMLEVLPSLRREVSSYRPGQGHNRPLFDRIEIDVWMSEEERKLSIDEERVSSLEALHEDLYFNTLDYFAHMGLELEGKSFDAPGGVHPFMHVTYREKPRALIRVYSWEDKQIEQWTTTSIQFNREGHFFKAIMTNGHEEITRPVEAFELPSQHIHKDVQDWISHQSQYRILYPDHSYRGHAIPVFECFLDAGEEFYSTLKMSLFKKTIFIEAGHHANEVSSTPAVLKLLERADGHFDHLLKDMNIVILPLANPDGYELMLKLTEEHPEWKHHAARYNAVGLEYSLVRFHETVFGEANIYPEILRRWAPDIIIDDHGIPSHEWVQPFAGYNSPPRFPVSYFLPSAKIYGIGRLSKGEFRPTHEVNLDVIANRISHWIKGTKIEEENQYWKERFKKYGNQWLPKVFPIEEVPGIHFYRQSDVAPSYSTIGITRYPEWIAAEVISEAADETVYGEVLESCIEAHILFDLAILEALQKAEIDVERHNKNGLGLERRRPLRLS